MTREELSAMGLSEEHINKIMTDYGKANTKADKLSKEMESLKEKASSAEELQRKLDEIEQQNLTELEKEKKAREAAEANALKMQQELTKSNIAKIFAEGGLVGENYDGMIAALSNMDMETAKKSAESFVKGITETNKTTLDSARSAWEKEKLLGTENPSGKGTQSRNEEKSSAAEFAKQYSARMNPQQSMLNKEE